MLGGVLHPHLCQANWTCRASSLVSTVVNYCKLLYFTFPIFDSSCLVHFWVSMLVFRGGPSRERKNINLSAQSTIHWDLYPPSLNIFGTWVKKTNWAAIALTIKTIFHTTFGNQNFAKVFNSSIQGTVSYCFHQCAKQKFYCELECLH